MKILTLFKSTEHSIFLTDEAASLIIERWHGGDTASTIAEFPIEPNDGLTGYDLQVSEEREVPRVR